MKPLKEGLLSKKNIGNINVNYFIMVPIEKDWEFMEFEEGQKFENYKYDFPKLDVWIFQFRDFAKLFKSNPKTVADNMRYKDSDIFMTNKRLDEIINDFRSKFYDVIAIYKDKNYTSLRHGTSE